jgi:hypothetical protein
MQRVRGLIHPTSAVCANAGTARGENCLSSRQIQANLTSSGGPLGECGLTLEEDKEMSGDTVDPDAVLKELQKQDGILWRRILGQQHWHFDELPFWVIFDGREQLLSALQFLQDKLQALQGFDGANITVSFGKLTKTEDIFFAYYKGEEFFSPQAKLSLDIEPVVRPREKGVFDYLYPDEEWSTK